MTRPWIPGAPAAGHISATGYWHPGAIDGCPKCPLHPARAGKARVRIGRGSNTGRRSDVVQNMTSHLDTCEAGAEVSCPDCVKDGIIQTAECDTCGTARWVHVCGGRIYNPVTS